VRPDARHHVDEDIFEHRGGELAQEEVQQHEVPDPQAASGRLRQGSVAVAGRRTDQGDIGAQRRVTAERLSAKVAGAVGMRGETQQSKGHTE